MRVYLDNAATTQCYKESANLLAEISYEHYGNPSSIHNMGNDAEKYISITKEIIAKNLEVNKNEIIFTSGGTESNNIAIFGVCKNSNKRHIITSKIEHPSVYNVFKKLESEGFRVTYLDVDNYGFINIEQLKKSIFDDTLLVSIMHVNNEIGSIQNIENIGKIIKNINKDIIFHVDCVQSFGKFYLYPKKWNIDLLSASGHKINGPKGIGFLYINKDIKIAPLIYGGGQQFGIRSGTENVAAIAAMGNSILTNNHIMEESNKDVKYLKQLFIKNLPIDRVHINSPKNNCSDWILNISFNGIKNYIMLAELEQKGIMASAGSACSSNFNNFSRVLQAMNLNEQYLESCIRFSFSHMNRPEEIIYATDIIKDILKKYNL